MKDRDGKDVLLTLHIPAGTFNQEKGFLEGIIIVGNGTTDTFSVKQLEANIDELLTTYTFSINANASNISLIASGGVLDKDFGHNNRHFIYLPISVYPTLVDILPDNGAPYEKKWLNNNLGANYAKVGNNQHSQQAISDGDYNAYGYFFQWQRPADGHEFITWQSATIASEKSDVVRVPQGGSGWTATHSNFISFLSDESWVDNAVYYSILNRDLWQKGGTNNPCPMDYHVPTDKEWTVFYTQNGDDTKGRVYWSTISKLHLPAAGLRSGLFVAEQNIFGRYWSSSDNEEHRWARLFNFHYEFTEMTIANTKFGLPIRCIAD